MLLGSIPVADASAADNSHLPIPRFVSIKFDKVSVRVGPGKQYPIDWVFTRKDLPVEVIGKFDVWWKIRDPDGVEGWVTQQSISGSRFVVIKGEVRMLRQDPNDAASPVAQAEPTVIGKLLGCPAATPDWCRVEIGALRGWLRRAEIWGVYPGEIVSK
jgi:SH3-like domain-containing protein